MIRLMIADDHAVVREGVKHIISEIPDIVVAGEATNGSEVFAEIHKKDFDLLLLDIAMPGRDGLDILKEVKTQKPRLPVLILSMYREEQFVLRALKSGASGYLTKDSIPDERVCDKFIGNTSGCRTMLPEIFPAIAEEAAPQSDNIISAVYSPVHSGLFQPLSDNRTATRLKHS